MKKEKNNNAFFRWDVVLVIVAVLMGVAYLASRDGEGAVVHNQSEDVTVNTHIVWPTTAPTPYPSATATSLPPTLTATVTATPTPDSTLPAVIDQLGIALTRLSVLESRTPQPTATAVDQLAITQTAVRATLPYHILSIGVCGLLCLAFWWRFRTIQNDSERFRTIQNRNSVAIPARTAVNELGQGERRTRFERGWVVLPFTRDRSPQGIERRYIKHLRLDRGMSPSAIIDWVYGVDGKRPSRRYQDWVWDTLAEIGVQRVGEEMESNQGLHANINRENR